MKRTGGLRTADHDQARYQQKDATPFTFHIQDITRTDPPAIFVDAHWHEHIELLYQYGGEANVMLAGQPVTLRKGELLFIGTREVHRISGDSDCHYLCLRFSQELVDQAGGAGLAYRNCLPADTPELHLKYHYTADELKRGPVLNLLYDISQESNRQDLGYELAIRSDISRIYLWLLRDWEERGLLREQSTPLSQTEAQALDRVMDYIDQNYAESLTAADCAKLIGQGYSCFSRFFSRATGQSFSDFVCRVRLREAERRLTGTNDSVTDIALDVGFSSSSYFISCFKDKRGLTPLQYRKQMRHSNQPPAILPDNIFA